MEYILESISEGEFKDEVNIRFKNILDGLNNYSNGLLEHKYGDKDFSEKEADFLKFFGELLSVEKEVIVDFYIKDLDDDSKDKLLEALDENDKKIFLNHINCEEIKSVYFKLNSKELMDFITKLNTREQFFCTIYLRKNPMTIWGNYNLSFPIFFKDKNILKFYEDLANKNNLILNNLTLE